MGSNGENGEMQNGEWKNGEESKRNSKSGDFEKNFRME